MCLYCEIYCKEITSSTQNWTGGEPAWFSRMEFSWMLENNWSIRSAENADAIVGERVLVFLKWGYIILLTNWLSRRTTPSQWESARLAGQKPRIFQTTKSIFSVVFEKGPQHLLLNITKKLSWYVAKKLVSKCNDSLATVGGILATQEFALNYSAQRSSWKSRKWDIQPSVRLIT